MGLTTGHLLYADGGDPPAPFHVVGTGMRLVVHRIDLTRPIPQLEAQIRTLAALLAGEEETVRIA